MARRLKIITGLVLFAFVTVHLVNLAVGFFSLPVADDIRPALLYPFTNIIGSYIVVASAMLHMMLGVQALYHRNTLRMTWHDTVQFATALLIPPLLIPHAWVLIANHRLLGIAASYFDMFQYYWVTEPLSGLRQVLLVMVIWIHGCIGLFTWLRLKPWWPKVASIAYPLAVAIPVLALLAFVDGGKRALGESGLDSSGNYRESQYPDNSGRPAISGDDANKGEADSETYGYGATSGSRYGQGYGAPSSSDGSTGVDDNRDAYGSGDSGGAYADDYSSSNTGSLSGPYGAVSGGEDENSYGASDYASTPEAEIIKGGRRTPPRETDPDKIRTTVEFIDLVKWRIIIGYLALLLLVLAARAFRLRGNKETVEIHYANGEILTRPVGLNLLEISNINDIPHASLCRGRGRCGTCRIRIHHSQGALDPPGEIERETLARTGSESDVRLACQLKPGPGVITIERLLSPDVQYLDTEFDEPAAQDSTAVVTEKP